MSFRTRLLLAFSVIVAAAVLLVSVIVSSSARSAFERTDNERTRALVVQFRRDFAQQGEEIGRRLDRLAASPGIERMLLAVGRPGADTAQYVNEAQNLAAAQGLDLLEILAADGSIISSAQWPARFGYRDDWSLHVGQAREKQAFLKQEELATETVPALVAVREVAAGERKLYLAGGQRVDKQLVASLSIPAGMRVMLVGDKSGAESTRIMGDETVQSIPLTGKDGEPLGALLVASSRRDLLQLQRDIVRVASTVGGAGIAIGIAAVWWITARVTRPVEKLAQAATQVAGGNWETRVEVHSSDEIGRLASSFNAMTQQLVEQRERLVQAERVAAWRELARRLAHELKNPLFPVQITIENLRRAREQHHDQFDEIFRESITTLLTELANLKSIVGRFSDFAKMPKPERRSVQVNDLARRSVQLLQAQMDNAQVRADLTLDENLPEIQADPDLLRRVLDNLLLNALDAMPQGGILKVASIARETGIRLEVSDTGAGLTSEECERLFTPYYTTKKHGTGLGLAIVQSVISDHGGTIAVASEVGRGTTFRMDLPDGTSAHS